MPARINEYILLNTIVSVSQVTLVLDLQRREKSVECDYGRRMSTVTSLLKRKVAEEGGVAQGS